MTKPGRAIGEARLGAHVRRTARPKEKPDLQRRIPLDGGAWGGLVISFEHRHELLSEETGDDD